MSEHIEFRAETNQPTKPGWYFAKLHQRNFPHPFPIEPVKVVEVPENPNVPVIMWRGEKRYAVGMSWFGPVVEVREASR